MKRRSLQLSRWFCSCITLTLTISLLLCSSCVEKKEEGEEEGIPQEDIDLVAEQTGKSKKEAEKALTETKGDIAEAIMKLIK